MTAGEAARLTAQELAGVSGEESVHEARLLVSALLGVEPKAFSLHRGMSLEREQLIMLADWTQRRKKREPLQYILGQWPFYGYDFIVNPSALIPRPETEELCENAIRLIRERGYESALDLCTGTGCIASVLKLETGISVAASDINPEAIALAEENASLYDADIEFFTGDLFSPLGGRRFDLIVTNPPYLSAKDMQSLQPELAYEPKTALDGGLDGMDFYRRIARDYRQYLNADGMLLMEIGADEGERVREMFPGSVLRNDLSGHARMIIVPLGRDL